MLDGTGVKMIEKKQRSIEKALEQVIGTVKIDHPITIGEIADHTKLSWAVVKRAVDLIMMIQDYTRAYRISVLKGRGRKIVVTELRVDLTKLPKTVREWFIEEYFFKSKDGDHYTIEVDNAVLETGDITKKRTRLEDAIIRILKTLEVEDDLSILGLSRRTRLNNRTVERSLNLLTRIQDKIADSFFRYIEGSVVRQKHPNLYALDETRMIWLLKKIYLPHLLREDITKEKERSLFQVA